MIGAFAGCTEKPHRNRLLKYERQWNTSRARTRAKLELDEYNHARQREAQPQPSGLKILGRARLRARLQAFLA